MSLPGARFRRRESASALGIFTLHALMPMRGIHRASNRKEKCIPFYVTERYREMTNAARVAWECPYSLKLPRWLNRVKTPTLLLWGAQDWLIPSAQSGTWARLIPGARIEIVEGAGHLVLAEKPQAVAKVADFLEGE